MGKILAGILFLALAVYIVAVAVDDIKQAKIESQKAGVENSSIKAKANADVVKYSGYVIGALGIVLIAGEIAKKIGSK